MPAATNGNGHRWWQHAVGYEVYVRSFQDSDGDGIGDLEGVRRRLPYLARLGVDIVWLTPFYPSPQADHGYDVADYTDVDPTFGSLTDVDRLVAEAHQLGLRIVVDLVPNHSSSQHPWFRAALAGDPRYRDYYVWADTAPDGGPPNNWVSNFGGPAWTFEPRVGRWYLHLFLPDQPDLNWANPAVRDEFDRILTFWFERGIDGLRIDVAHALTIDPDLRDNPLRGAAPAPGAHPGEVFAAYEHLHDQDQEDVLDIYRRWNRIAAEHDAFLVGEVYLLRPERLTRYVAGGDVLHSAFCFPTLHASWDANDIRTTLAACVAAGGDALSWPLSSHDDPHAATRFGGGERGSRRARAYLTLLCALPGIPFLYQGDELGLGNGEVDPSLASDPVATRNAGAVGRDGSRTPMPWAPRPNLGFTTGQPWLPLGGNRSERDTVAAQEGDPASPLERTRRLLAVRRQLAGAWRGVRDVAWLDGPDEAVAFRRGDVVAVLAVSDVGVVCPLPDGDWHVAYVSSDAAVVEGGAVVVPPDAAVLLRASSRTSAGSSSA